MEMNSYVLKHLKQCLVYPMCFPIEVFAVVITKSASQTQTKLVLNSGSYSVSSFEALGTALYLLIYQISAITY